MDRDPPITIPEALTITIETAGALAYAHGHGVVHRDVKPENILLEGGHALLADFGIAREILGPGRLAVTDSASMIGTPLYMSPEQAGGDSELDARSDLYSLACVLFEMLGGAPPFTGSTAEAILVQRFTRPPPRLSARRSDVPRRLDAALFRAMARDRADRFPSIERFVAVLSDATPSRTEAGERTIAVLPFGNLGGSVEDEYFTDGMTEEIMNALAQVRGLRVAARMSSFSFKGKNEDLRVIGDKLGVTTVLEGSVRRAGPRLRITTQLVDVADGHQLWSERYDRELTDVFAIQEEIATAIASKLKVTLATSTESARRGTSNLQAYELFLKGRVLQWRRGRWLPEALRCLERAVVLDPEFAEALALLADSYRLLGLYGALPPDASMPKAKALAERALELDPDLAEAHAALANVALLHDRDGPAAERSWRRALEIHPEDTRARGEFALWWLVVMHGDASNGVIETKQVVENDPISSWASAMHSLTLAAAGRHEEATAEGIRAVELDPDSFLAHWSLLNAYRFARDFGRMIETAQTALPASGRHPWVLGRLASAYVELGRSQAAEAVHLELHARAQIDYVQTSLLAITAAATGRIEEAMSLAFRALEERDPVLLSLKFLPDWDPLRSHPRFPELLRSAGLSPGNLAPQGP
jgi:serine/threonine-protein kinase